MSSRHSLLVQGSFAQSSNIIAEGPHLAQRIPGAREPVPIPSTNYKWKSETPIPDLESHIAQVQQRRYQLAREAELVWSWLSEAEADFYNTLAKHPDDAPEKQRKLQYLETLGIAHQRIWREANACDWIVADSHKRIAQLRSAEEANGTITWRSVCSEAAAQTEPQWSKVFLRAGEQSGKQVREQLQAAQARLATDLVVGYDDDGEAASQQVYHPVHKKMVTQKHMLAEVKK